MSETGNVTTSSFMSIVPTSPEVSGLLMPASRSIVVVYPAGRTSPIARRQSRLGGGPERSVAGGAARNASLAGGRDQRGLDAGEIGNAKVLGHHGGHLDGRQRKREGVQDVDRVVGRRAALQRRVEVGDHDVV